MTWQFRSKSQVLSAATLPVPGIFLPPGAWTSHKLVQCCLQGKARCLDMTHTSRAEAEATGHLQVTHTPTTKQLLRRKEGVQGAVERALGCGTEEGKGPEPPGPRASPWEPPAGPVPSRRPRSELLPVLPSGETQGARLPVARPGAVAGSYGSRWFPRSSRTPGGPVASAPVSGRWGPVVSVVIRGR